MEKQRCKTSLVLWFCVASLVSQNLVVPVMCRAFEDQKTYYPSPDPSTGGTPPSGGSDSPPSSSNPSPDPSVGGTPPSGGSGSPPSGHGSGSGSPHHGHHGHHGHSSSPPHGGSGGSPNCGNPPSQGGGGSYTPTPTTPSSPDPTTPTTPSTPSYTPTPTTPLTPDPTTPSTPTYTPTPTTPTTPDPTTPSTPTYTPPTTPTTPDPTTPSTPTYTPTPTTPTPDIFSPPSTPSIDPGTPSFPGIFTPPSLFPPFLPDPNSPFTGTCTYWSSHPGAILGLLGWWGTMGNVFSLPSSMSSFPGSGLTLPQALSNTRHDGLGALYREGTASLLNSMANPRFHFSTQQVRDQFASALVSDRAASAQARLFQQANEGRLKPRG